MSYEERSLVQAGDQVYYVMRVKELIGGVKGFLLMKIDDGVMLPMLTESELITEKFVPMRLVPMRTNKLQRVTRPLFKRNTWVRHEKTGGIYQIVQTPEHRYLEATGQACYEYRNSDGIKFNRCQEEMEDGRFTAVSLAQIRELFSGTVSVR